MSGKKRFSLKKFLEYFFGYHLFRIWIFWTRHLSFDSLESYGERLGVLAFYFLRRRRRNALGNLHLVLGKEKSKEAIEQICLECFKNIGRDMMENSRLLDFEDSYFRNYVKFEGKEHLDLALKKGKGVIAVSAHFGNFPLMCVRLVNEGYPLSLVARDPENPRIARRITSFRDAIGMESIPDKPRMTCVSRSLKALKENRILMLHIDQNAPVTEAWVDFFGYLVPTFKGPMIFSLRTGAVIIPMFIIRDPDYHHKIIIHPPFDLNLTGDVQNDIVQNIAQLTKLVEGTVREYPEHWWWVHRRFKRARDVKTGERLFTKHD